MAPIQPVTIEPAQASDFPSVIRADRAASELFRPTGLLSDEALADTVSRSVLDSGAKDGLLDVARTASGEIAGFTLVSLRGSGLYLDQISVDPRFGRQGIGRVLMHHVERKAAALGVARIDLSTFRDLPWNAPFYASVGYHPLPRDALEPFMVEIEQAQKPFMDVTKRVFMRKHVRKDAFHAKRPE